MLYDHPSVGKAADAESGSAAAEAADHPVSQSRTFIAWSHVFGIK